MTEDDRQPRFAVDDESIRKVPARPAGLRWSPGAPDAATGNPEDAEQRPSADPGAMPPSAFGAPPPLPSQVPPPLPVEPPPAPPSGGGPPLPPRWEPPSRAGEPYPMRFDVAYPERLSRWKTLLRAFLVIPAYVFVGILDYVVQAGFLAGWVAVFVRRKYPRWLFAGLTGALGFNARVASYGLLLTDQYPSFESGEHPAQLEYAPPPQGELSRWRVLLWKIVVLTGHLVVLAFLWLAVLAVTVIAWFAILITGRYPRGLFGFVTGVLRWHLRTLGYLASFNDRFPPFALGADAGPGGRGAALASAIAGVLLIGGCTAGAITVSVLEEGANRTDVDYAALVDGQPAQTFITGDSFDPTFAVRLERATDPAGDLLPVLDAPGTRAVVFHFAMLNGTSSDREFSSSRARLRIEAADGDRKWVKPALVVVNGEPAPGDLEEDEESQVRIAFLIPLDAELLELRVDPPWPAFGDIKYQFR